MSDSGSVGLGSNPSGATKVRIKVRNKTFYYINMSMVNCRYCGQSYSNKGIHHHEKFCKSNPNSSQDREYLRLNGIKTSQWLREHKTPKKEHQLICPRCGSAYSVYITDSDWNTQRYKKYCSRSCSNARHPSQETKDKISISVQKEKICKCCGVQYKTLKGSKFFCSNECKEKWQKDPRHRILSDEARAKLSEAGRKSIVVQGDSRRSKNEILFCSLCEKQFSSTIHNIPMFDGWDADVIIPELKIAILWNGIWHCEQISKSSSLKQIQKRDEIKLQKIKESGYKPYIIIDKGKFNEEFVNKQFEDFLLNISSL